MLRLAHCKMLARKRTWIRGEIENHRSEKLNDFGELHGRVVGDTRDCQLRTSVGYKIKLDVVRIVNDLRSKALARRERN